MKKILLALLMVGTLFGCATSTDETESGPTEEKNTPADYFGIHPDYKESFQLGQGEIGELIKFYTEEEKELLNKKYGRLYASLLDYYLEMIRSLHLRTYDYLGQMKASVNPIGFTQGGFYGGNLNYNDKIEPILKHSTASFGYTALNELCLLHSGKSIREDNSFAVEVLTYINNKVEQFKKEDKRLYAIYGTPKMLGL